MLRLVGRRIQQTIREEGKSRACEDSAQICSKWGGFGTGGPAKKQGRRRSITPTALPAPDIKIGSRRPVNCILTRFFTGKCDPVHKRRNKVVGQAWSSHDGATNRLTDRPEGELPLIVNQWRRAT
jgi:hypothetical protein